MPNSYKPQCYGDLFPDLLTLDFNHRHAGQVFACQINSAGIGVQSVAVETDDRKWEQCVACPHHLSCYDLSMAKLAFTHAVLTRAGK